MRSYDMSRSNEGERYLELEEKLHGLCNDEHGQHKEY